MILKSARDEPREIQSGATEVEIAKRFGLPIKSTRLESPTPMQRLAGNDQPISVLNDKEQAVHVSVFGFKGRLDSKARAGQAGFDSLMTLGLAEFYLIPKAIWENSVDDNLQLTVWFGPAGQALGYQWAKP